MSGRPRSFPRTAVFVSAGLLIWALDFLVIYVFASLACARGFADSTLGGVGLITVVSIASTSIAFGAATALLYRGWRQRPASHDEPPDNGTARGFVAWLAAMTALLGLVAVTLTGLPGLIVLRAC